MRSASKILVSMAMLAALSACPNKAVETNKQPPIGATSSSFEVSYDLDTATSYYILQGRVTAYELSMSPTRCADGESGKAITRLVGNLSYQTIPKQTLRKGCSYTTTAKLGILNEDKSALSKIYFFSINAEELTSDMTAANSATVNISFEMTALGKQTLAKPQSQDSPNAVPDPEPMPNANANANPNPSPQPTPETNLPAIPSQPQNQAPTPNQPQNQEGSNSGGIDSGTPLPVPESSGTPSTPTGPATSSQNVELDQVTFTLPQGFKAQQVAKDGETALVSMAKDSKPAFFYSKPAGFKMASAVSKRAKIVQPETSYGACGQLWRILGTQFSSRSRAGVTYSALFQADIGSKTIFGYVTSDSIADAVNSAKQILNSCREKQ